MRTLFWSSFQALSRPRQEEFAQCSTCVDFMQISPTLERYVKNPDRLTGSVGAAKEQCVLLRHSLYALHYIFVYLCIFVVEDITKSAWTTCTAQYCFSRRSA